MCSKAVILAPVFNRILARFPQQLNFCFAYGSAVKKQLKNDSKDNMIDLIFCVDNSQKWHELNMKQNPSHYSSLKYLGHNFVSKFQENFGAKIYFNTLVPLEGVIVKYGVISTKDSITDLLEWSDLYLAGRLHKPVEILKHTSNSEMQTALQLNLQSAVHSALLILPESFTEYEFYYTLSNLSYSGDFRMIFGEKKNKVENIVKPQLNSFRQLYKPFLISLSDYVDFPGLKEGNDENSDSLSIVCSQDINPLARLHHLNQLPRWPQKALTRLWNRGSLRQDTEDVLRAIAYDPDCNEIVVKCLNSIVWKSSVSQSVKGIATAGLLKSVQYSSRKIQLNVLKQTTLQKLISQFILGKIHTVSYRNDVTVKMDKQNEKIYGPILPGNVSTETEKTSSIELDKTETYGPALPPHLLKKASTVQIGPALPHHLREQLDNQPSASYSVEESNEEDDIYGPALPGNETNLNSQLALEERALEIKLNQLNPEEQHTQREEWMIELPTVSASKLGLSPRQFRANAGPDMSDRSSWTDTPSSKKNKKTETFDLKNEMEKSNLKKRDKEQEKMAKKHKTESFSLLEIHQKKRKEENKLETKERKPFNRETDLQVNKFDEAQKAAVLKKAQLLDDRFSKGTSKFL